MVAVLLILSVSAAGIPGILTDEDAEITGLVVPFSTGITSGFLSAASLMIFLSALPVVTIFSAFLYVPPIEFVVAQA